MTGKHSFDDATIKDVRDGMMAAKKIAIEVFGPNARSRDVFVVYDALMSAMHCDHEAEKPKEPWEE